MIVCHCRALSDRAIRAAIEAGADEDDLAQQCGAGGKCGGCRPALRRLLAEHRRHDTEARALRLAPA
jgi:bacterioferritin-associated ferredoxin